jgi:hypothetical protein
LNVAKKTKKLADRVRELLDTLVDAVESLLSPPPAPVPVRARPKHR